MVEISASGSLLAWFFWLGYASSVLSFVLLVVILCVKAYRQ